MKRFLLSSQKFPGTIELLFDEIGHLCRVDFINTALLPEHKKTFLNVVPIRMDGFEEAFKGKAIIVVEEGFEYSFNDFWNKYNLKRNKKDAETLWNKLSLPDKAKAVITLDAYDRYRKRKQWLEKMYPDTYLRKEHFNDEWDKLN